MNWKSSVFLKKARRYGTNAIRPILKQFPGNSLQPVLVNSFPKSGTHLLTQLVSPLIKNDYGNFIASTPSFSMKEASTGSCERRVRSLLHGELCSAHLFFSPEAASAVATSGVRHIFIYRDPRDVILSEAHYLGSMNRWHRLYPYFSRLSSMEEKIRLCITGLPSVTTFYYPDAGTRMKRYSPWITENHTLALRYEDLMSAHATDCYRSIWEFITQGKEALYPTAQEYLDLLPSVINPELSHTFHKAETGRWRSEFSAENLALFSALAGDETRNWGYSD